MGAISAQLRHRQTEYITTLRVDYQADEGIEAISEFSSKMSGIISVIDGIAFQTNILALNAAVEAARAG